MSKKSISYICSNCGYISKYWLGRCPSCQEWDSFVINGKLSDDEKNISKNNLKVYRIDDIATSSCEVFDTGLSELNRCLGGGIYKNNLILLAGEPGVGKSTLSLQVASFLSSKIKILYVTAEENYGNIKLRFDRISKSGNLGNNLFVLDNNVVDDILEVATEFDIIFLDSIQAVRAKDLSTPIGSISQVKASIDMISDFCKINNKTFFILAHVTKGGYIAGPKFLEHMVDVVLLFEGKDEYRVIRVLKNRNGSTDEIGVFLMTERGLREDTIFYFENIGKKPGSVFSLLPEGTKFIPLELQTLVNKSFSEKPKRIIWGVDNIKVMVITSLIEKFLKLDLYKYDIIMSVRGILKVFSSYLDLSIAVSIISSYILVPVGRSIFIGNLSLYSNIEPISKSRFKLCLLEASKLSIENIFSNFSKDEVISEYPDLKNVVSNLSFFKVENLEDILKLMVERFKGG